MTVEADAIGHLTAETVAPVYFCFLEPLQNTANCAQASTARISLHATSEALSFTAAACCTA